MGIEMFGLPRDLRADVQFFVCPSAAFAGNVSYLSLWKKPRGVSMVFILVIGGGGGGGGGFSASSGNARGGGGGGGCGGVCTVLVPAALLPDRLICNTHSGGVGGTAGVAGAGAGNTFVITTRDFSTLTEIVAASEANQAGGGGAGTAAGAGAGGSAGTSGGYSISGMAGLGHLQAINGQTGFAGGAHTGAVGTSITIPTTGICNTGGAGGAGVTAADFAGGGVTAIANTLISDYRPLAAAAGSFDGPGGIQMWRPFFGFGGLGGSSSNAGVGGNGGIGAIGCGGGGGGGGTTGGRGGDGGPGAVLFIAW